MSDTGFTKSEPSPRNKAMDLLARREHSVFELRAKLVAREFEPDAIDTAIDSLVREGLISDDRFAAAFVASRVRRGQGPIRIRGELRQRGVAEGLIDTNMDAADADWIGLARSVREKKFGPARSLAYRDRARQSRFLQHRGFSTDQIRAAFGDDPAGADSE